MTSSFDILGPSGLQTEFFQLVQSALYHADGMWGDATVDLYLRDLPADQGYIVVAGIEQAVQGVLNLRFSEDDIKWLSEQPLYKDLGGAFFDRLRHFRFQGEIWAMQEGTPAFPHEPILRITAPLPQIGLFEMLLTQTVGSASTVATNASRLCQAAQGKAILDFGTRRVPGRELAETAARAAFIGGCSGTTHALAARNLGIPVVGLVSDTMLAAYEDVELAYDALSAHFPDGCHLNLPTEAPLDAIERFERIQDKVQTVRVDHPDLEGISREIRKRLDAKGMTHTKILGSGNLDALSIHMLVSNEAPIDLFAVGGYLTQGLAGSGPQFSYRMAALVRGATPAPITGHWSAHWPGVKRVFRFSSHDLVCSEVEASEVERLGGVPLLHPWVLQGERANEETSIKTSREVSKQAVDGLSVDVRRLCGPGKHPVRPSKTIEQLQL
jgi:nicotinate phosphoribosyltransferase